MNKKIIITGATGLIGKALTKMLSEMHYEITVFSRDISKSKRILTYAANHFNWNNATSEEISFEFENAYSIVNLAGVPIAAKRWTEIYKMEIYNSRIDGTKKIIEAIKLCKKKPKSLINASAIGYYGNQGDTILTEDFHQGTGFLADVTGAWENEADNCSSDVRVVKARIGVVLDKTGGALEKMVTPFKLFIGGPIGSGSQWLSWIHSEDLINALVFLVENENISGAVNCVSPYPIQMKNFSTILGSVLNRPSWIKVPEFILNLILGESSEMVTSSLRVSPDKLLKMGFNFKYSNLEKALNSIFKKL